MRVVYIVGPCATSVLNVSCMLYVWFMLWMFFVICEAYAFCFVCFDDYSCRVVCVCCM